MLRVLVGIGLTQADSPITKIVGLITELKANIEADGKVEQKVHDDFACWCDDTKQKKTNDIDAAGSSIELLDRKIVSQEGSRGTYEASIAQLEKDIGANVESRKQAATLRDKESDTYAKERLETEQCIGALEHAVKVLQGAGGQKVDASNLREVQMLSIVAGVRSALHKLPRENVLSREDVDVVSRFVKDPEHYGTAQAASFLQVHNNPFGDYAPKSSKIQGILKNMFDTFVAQLESANTEEAVAKKHFDDLMESKLQDFDTLTENLLRKKQDHGDNNNSLAENKQERADTKQQLKDDKAFLQNTKDNCKQHATAWAERSRLRTEELSGITQALGILNSPEAQKTFGSATSSFLQFGSPRAMEAFSSLKKVAQKHHSLRLASLAAAVKTSQRGHFDVVLSAIDKMIAVIRQEDGDDIRGKDACERQASALRAEGSDLKHATEQEELRTQRLEEKIGNLQSEKKKTAQDKTDTEDEMKSALDARVKESDEFKKALKDDRDAVALLGQAMETMKAMYVNNKIPLTLMQHNEDPAPPEGFSKPYGGRSSETGGIVSILGMVKEDLENEIKESIKAEEDAAAEYEKAHSTATKALRALKSKLANLGLTISNAVQKQGQSGNQLALLADKDGVNGATWGSHCRTCGWIYSTVSNPADQCAEESFGEVSSFTTRKENRKSELEGLINAKATLAGAGADDSPLLLIR